MINKVVETLKHKVLPEGDVVVRQVRKLPQGAAAVYRTKVPSKEEPNSAVVAEYQVGAIGLFDGPVMRKTFAKLNPGRRL